MQNMTSDTRVVYESPDLNPIEGYVLVIFEQRGEGRVFKTTIRPGEKFKGPRSRLIPFSSSPDHFAYRVSTDTKLRLKFTDRVDLQDQVHTVDLHYIVSYSVSDYRKIADIFHTDPLTRLQDEIKLVIGGTVSNNRWEMIRDHFEVIKMELLGPDAIEMDRISDFASELGIQVNSIEMKPRLLEINRRALIAESQAYEEQKLAEIKKRKAQHQLELDQKFEEAKRQARIETESKFLLDEQDIQSQKEMHKLQLEFQKKMLESFTTGVGNLADGTDNADVFRRNGEAILQLIQRFFESKSARQYQQTTKGPLLQGGSYQAVMGQLPESTGGILRMIQESWEHVNKLTCQQEEKNRLFSAILHLLAELMAGGEDNNDEAVERYGDKVKELALKLRQYMPSEQFSFFRQFQDCDTLRQYLK